MDESPNIEEDEAHGGGWRTTAENPELKLFCRLQEIPLLQMEETQYMTRMAEGLPFKLFSVHAGRDDFSLMCCRGRSGKIIFQIFHFS